MQASYLRHKCRLRRFVHRMYTRPGSTMVLHPLLPFARGKPARSTLAADLWGIRHNPEQLQAFKALACF